MMLAPTHRALLLAISASALFWGVLAVTDVRIDVVRAELPNMQAILGSVDERLGEKVLDQAKKQVDTRFAQEKAAYEGKYDDLVGQTESAQELISKAQEQAETYQRERKAQSAAALTTTYLQKGYADMLEEHTGQLSALTEIQETMNDLQKAYNTYKQIFVKAKMLAGR